MEAKILSQHHRISRRLDRIESKKQIESLLTFLPEEILTIISSKKDEIVQSDGVVLLIDISCIDTLSKIDTKIAQEGVFRVNATINMYLSAIIEIINFYEGDVQRLIPAYIIAVWKSKPEICLYKLIDEVIFCALHVQKVVEFLNVKMEMIFRTKQIISCGSITLGIIGDSSSKSWVLLGDLIQDCRVAGEACNPGEILLTFNAWGHLYEDRYVISRTSKGYIQILDRIFRDTEQEQEKKRKTDIDKIMSLCSEHLRLRNVLCEEINIDTPLSKCDAESQKLIKIITPRRAIESATNSLLTKEIEPFIVKPVKDKINEYQPLAYLTEICEATIQTIYVAPTYCRDKSWFNLINKSYGIIHKIVSKKFGFIIETQMEWNRTTIFRVAFGLQGNIDESEKRNALTTSHVIIEELKILENLENVNIIISNQLVHCSVLGHPLRQNYFVMGSKSMKEPTSVRFRIFCDYAIYENSKLSSDCFLQQDCDSFCVDLDGEIFLEYNETFKAFRCHSDEEIYVIGRNDELEYIRNILVDPKKVDDYHAVVIKGRSKSGKTIILKKSRSDFGNKFPSAYVNLYGGNAKPYFCVSAIYRQLFDFHSTKLKGEDFNIPSKELWNFKDTLQLKKSCHSEDIQRSMKIFEAFFQICKMKTDFSVIIIDNIQFIDAKSLQLLEDMLKSKAIRLISAGLFEEDKLHILWKFSLSNQFKILDLEPLGEEYIPKIICHFLNVHGVMKKIADLVVKVCDGRPGWIESCLLELLNKRDLEIKCMHYEESLKHNFIFPNDTMVKKEKNSEKYVRIAIIDNFCEKNFKYITPNVSAMNFIQSFPSYQQIIIKAAAVIGDIFTRSSLIVILQLSNNNFFAYAIKCLFDEEIFECGSKYFINNTALLSRELSCACYVKHKDKILYENFPKYAFCKIIHFRNRILRKIAYELLSVDQRRDLHLKITELLEYENTLCPQCSQQRSSAIIQIKKYKDMIVLMEPTASRNTSTFDIENMKNVIRQQITESTVKENDEIQTIPPNNISLKKSWNPATCFCLEILTRIYSDLVHHSQMADNLAKQIFFMYQYGSILILIGEMEDAIILLKEASQLCVFSNLEKYKISTEYSKFIFTRIVTAIAEAYYHLDNFKAAKNYILLCFRQQDIPIISLEYKICFKFLRRNERCVLNDFSSQGRGTEEYVGESLAILMRILIAENQWKLALSVAETSITLVKNENINFTLLCDIYSSALDICSIQGDAHTCEQLEKCCVSVLLQLFSTNGTIEFFAIAKLMSTLFVIKAKKDIIRNAIRLGYRLYNINYMLHAEIFQMETVPILAELLVSVKRIEDAVYSVLVTRKMTKNTIFSGDLLYFTFCIDLMLDSSFYIEKMDVIESFADKMHCDNTPIQNNIAKNYLVICIMTFYTRLCNWNKVEKWKNYQDAPNYNKNNHINMKLKMRYLELKLLQLARNMNSSKRTLEAEFLEVKNLMEKCLISSKNWKFFLPKCFMYHAYFYKLKKNKKYRRFLKIGAREAEINENLEIHCWINLNKHHWAKGYDNFLITDFPFVFWRKAKDVSITEWTQIMYPLPLP